MRKILLLAALAIVVTACEAPNPYEGTPTSTSRRVAVFGDSVTRAATPYGRAENDQLANPFLISWNGVNGAKTADFQGNYVYVGIDKPDIVVLAVGNNDASHSTGGGFTQDDVRTVDAALGAMADVPCILWVNTRSDISPEHPKWNHLLSLRMTGEGKRLLDWDAHSEGRDDWVERNDPFDPLHIHLTPAGYAAYAEWLSAEMVTGCPVAERGRTIGTSGASG